MSVSRKVLRKMKKVMGVIGAIPVLAACSSQISCAAVNVGFDPCNKILYFSGNGVIDGSWKERYTPESIRRVVIENGINKIDCGAFMECTSLQKVTIPNSVTSIGDHAFFYCPSLQEINIPNSVTSIGEYAFWLCVSLKEVIIPNSVTRIGRNTFERCRSLQEITIPNSVTSIGKEAFLGCKRLKTVIFENMAHCSEYCKFSCSDIGICKNAFKGCRSLTVFATGDRTAHFDVDSFNGCIQLFRQYENTAFRGWIRTNYYLIRHLISS